MNTDAPPPRPLDYARPIPRTGARSIWVLWVFVGLIVLGLFAANYSPPLTGSRPVANKVKCASNLRQIGQAMMLYATEHSGEYPATIADLLEEDITSSVFVCPESNDSPALGGPTTQAIAASVMVPGHLSYVILSKGFTTPPPVDAILAYEPLANHSNAGMNVLFGDGHVDFLQASDANKILAELKAGHNPPRAEAIK